MKLCLLLALVALVGAKEDHCIPPPTVPYEKPPPSVTRVTSAASLTDPSLATDIRVVEAIEVSSPTFAPVETEIESYARSHYDTLSLLEYYDESPSAVTNPSSFTHMETMFPTLASAVTALVSEEATHPSLGDVQSSFQAVMVAYPTIVTAGATSFEFSYPSLISDESGISKAAVSSPSIVTDVEVVTSMVSVSPSLSTYVSDLVSAAEDYPTALHELTTARSWTDTNAWYIDTTLKSLSSCYPTLATAITAIDTFLESHESDDSPFSDLVTALTYVPTIITDVTAFVTAVSSSFTEAQTALSPALQIDSHVTTDVSYVDVLEASHPSLSCAEGTLEREEVSHPSTVSDIEDAIASPSTVTNPAYISSLEHRYPSIVTAYEDVTSVEATHPSLVYVQSELASEELVVSTLLTAAQIVISSTSPSLVGDASDLAKIESVSPTITSALASLSDITKESPSLSCDFSVLASYAASYPSVLYTLAKALSSPSSVAPSSIASIAKLTAEYPSLASALRSIDSAEYTFPQMASVESALTFALTYAPSIISVYKQVTEYSAIVSDEVCSVAPYSD